MTPTGNASTTAPRRRRRRLGRRGLPATAVALILLFAAVHLLGWRQYASVLSGTGVGKPTKEFAGAVYVVCYLGFVVAVPILLIAAVLRQVAAVLARAVRHPKQASGR